MRRFIKGSLFAIACLAVVLDAAGQDVIPHRQDRLPNRPYSPAEAIEAMTVPPGFAVELVASEPEIVNPIAMTFDDQGRIWITESLEYPRKEAGAGRDRVKVLEDTDGDGQGGQGHRLRRGAQHPDGHRRRLRRRLGAQRPRPPVPAGYATAMAGPTGPRSSSPASVVPTPTSCPAR